MARMSRQSRPEIEGLEGRQLLNGRMEHALSPKLIVDPSFSRVFSYGTPAGAKVTVQVLGKGSLENSSVDPDGALNLVYSGTNALSQIQINVRGGRAPLRSVTNLTVAPNNYTGIGGQILGALVGPKVDLIPNGSINLTSGIGRLQLHSLGRNTQVHLRELPQTVQVATGTSSTVVTGTGTSAGTGTGTGTQSTTGSVLVTTTTNTPTLPPGTQGIAAPLPPTPYAPATMTEAGQTFVYTNDTDGGSTLQGISGLFTPGLNLVVSPQPTLPATPPPPQGVVVQVDQVNAGTPGLGTIGNGQIFGYDPTANTLIRFDERNGAALQSIAVGGTPTTAAGVGLGRNGRELVVLLGRGTTVQAFDAVTGAPVGQFSAANVAGVAFTGITGIAFNELSSTLTDANAQLVPGSANFGVAVAIDVTASLATHQAQPIGLPYGTIRGLELAGGAAGVASSTNLYATIAAHFDPFQFGPLLQQSGILTLAYANGSPVEAARTAIPNGVGSNPYFNAGPQGFARSNGTTRALGSSESLLALVSGVFNGQNVVTLYSPQGLASKGTIALNDPNLLVGLSNSFHPELAGTALVDVQGNIQAFKAKTVRGLALNDSGNLNLVKIASASDSTIIGQPFGHLDLGQRHNVRVLTPTRSVGQRGIVIVDPTLRPLGPLSLPN